MRCKYCGGEINLSVSRCVSCGRGVDATSDIRILHDLDSVAKEYGLDPNQSKYDLPPSELESGPPLEQRTSAELVPPKLSELKNTGIPLSTYYELLGCDGEEAATEDAVGSKTAASDAGDSAPDDDLRDSGGEPAQAGETDDPEAGEMQEEYSEGLRGKIELLLDRLDRQTEPVTERLRTWYNSKMPQLNRAQSSSKWERLALMGILATIVFVVVVLISLIVSSIPSSISGEWMVSEEGSTSLLTVEFSRGDVTVRVYDEAGEPHVYKHGTYETRRSNGHDLLTVTYEDGSISHLYYEINGITGEFTNVDTGSSDRYLRVD